MIDPSHLHFLLIQSHIAAGFVTLSAFWIPFFTRKGSQIHRSFGKLYYYAGSYVAVTAVFSALWALVGPDSYYFSNERNSEADELQFLWATLLYLGIFIFTDLRLGVRLIQTKDTPERLGSPLQKSLSAISGLVALWLLAYGLWQFRSTGGNRFIICIIVGGIGVLSTPGKLKFLANKSPTPRQWLYKHLDAMIGCSIGFHVAFFLFGFRSLVTMQWMDGSTALVVALSPIAFGLLAIQLWTRHYKKKYGDS